MKNKASIFTVLGNDSSSHVRLQIEEERTYEEIQQLTRIGPQTSEDLEKLPSSEVN